MSNGKTGQTPPRAQWSSHFVFILATTGSAVGLGNIWRFPYIAGENGGGAFILIYLACVVLIGIPILASETMLGRCGGANPVHSLAVLARRFNLTSYWRTIGWMGIIGGFMILSYYSIIAGWTMAYLFRSASGAFNYVSVEGAQNIFVTLVSDAEKLIAWHTLFILLTALIVGLGVNRGIERAVKWFIPLLFVILVFLLGYVFVESDIVGGLRFLFSFNTDNLTVEGALMAMGHAFLSLSIGLGAVMAYGSYLPGNASIFKTAVWIAALDTLVALMAGIVIFSLVAEFSLAAAGGPGLVFKVLPLAFGQIAGGAWLGTLFYFLLMIAAWTSAVSLLEPAVSWWSENFDKDRTQATMILATAVWVLGLVTVFSFSHPEVLTLAGKTLFDWLDFVSVNFILPIGGLLIIFFTAWKLPDVFVRSEIGLQSPTLTWAVFFIMRFVAPLGALTIFAYQLIA